MKHRLIGQHITITSTNLLGFIPQPGGFRTPPEMGDEVEVIPIGDKVPLKGTIVGIDGKWVYLEGEELSNTW